jgi:hydrogenase 3 maturation protease
MVSSSFVVFRLTDTSSYEESLKEWLSGAAKVVVAGIGNAIRFDDYVGVKIVEDLQGKVSSRVHLIECETVPESFMDEIIEVKPSHVLLIDAALLGLKPGDVQLFDVAKLENLPSISTHTLPLRIFCEYITQLAKTKIALLLIEPKNTDFGEGLTPEVAFSAGRTVQSLRDVLP